MEPSVIFDRAARRRVRDANAHAPEAFFTGLMIDELLARLDTIRRDFSRALVIGAEDRLIAALRARQMALTVIDPSTRRAARFEGHASDEDRDVYGIAAHDLVVACGTLDTVDDLPGALALIRRALCEDGAFIGTFAGAPSLPLLKAAVAATDARHGRAVARFHPLLDVRAAGDLLVRAGFALPVADLVRIDLAYRDLARLRADLRAAALSNVLAARYPVGRAWTEDLAAAFMAGADGQGRTHESVSLLVLTGWAPSPDQPKPARRGSGVTSLAAALERPR